MFIGLGIVSCGQPGHTHVYDKQNTDAKYLESPADCYVAARYHYSCECGAKGPEMFTYGNPLGHQPSNVWTSDEDFHWHICERQCAKN